MLNKVHAPSCGILALSNHVQDQSLIFSTTVEPIAISVVTCIVLLEFEVYLELHYILFFSYSYCMLVAFSFLDIIILAFWLTLQYILLDTLPLAPPTHTHILYFCTNVSIS